MRRLTTSDLVMTMLAVMTLVTSLPAEAQPTNDDFDNAITITALPYSDFINTTEATTAPDDPDDCAGLGPTVWYAYTPSTDMRIEANTFGSDYDTALSVYTGTRSDLNQIACNDDAGDGLQSRVTFDAVAGETYFFMVGAYASGEGGNLAFTVQEAPPPGPPLTVNLSIDPTGSFDQTGDVTIRGTVTCSRPAYADVSGEVRQTVGRFNIIRGFFYTFVFCDGETPWEATVSSEDGLFRGGPTKVSAWASAYDPDTGDFAWDEESVVVKLRGGQGRGQGQGRGRPAASMSSADLPKTFALEGNHPNPFNPQTTIRFSLPETSAVRLAIYDVRGRQVEVLIDESLSAGDHEVTFEARDLPSGVYFSRLEAAGQVFSNRMVLVK